jgi:hypothetical protein
MWAHARQQQETRGGQSRTEAIGNRCGRSLKRAARGGVADAWAHLVFCEFQSAPNLKFKTDAFPYSKNIQTLDDARVEYSEHLLQLG